MRKNLYRTLLVYGVLFIAAFYVYPTIGWMTLSDEQRQERLSRWAKEDTELVDRGYWGKTWKNLKRWAEFDRDMVINLGLDLQGGVQMVVGIDFENMDPVQKQRYYDRGLNDAEIIEEMQQQVLQRIERRINEFGAKEPIIQTMGTRQIQVQLPGEKDVDRAKKLVRDTAYLSFHIVAGPDEMADTFRKIDEHFKGDFVPRLRRPPLGGEGLAQVPAEQIEQVRRMVEEAKSVEGLIPPDRMIAFSREPKAAAEDKNYLIYLLHKEAIMTGDGLTMAAARPDDRVGGSRWMIYFSLNAESGAIFGDRTEQNLKRAMAIVVDGVVESAPVIQDRITTDGTITGHFNREEAVDLAIALNSGSLPVPVIEEQSGVVGPRLGADSIRKGVVSSLVGLVVVITFMVLYYHVVGIVACVALIFNGLLILAAMAYLGATLTLPGIAGLILTLGMAVDANVLIYERMREELRLGKSLLAVIDSGYSHAMSAILDSNVTTLIAAAVLLQVGSGAVQGFAVTLSIGILTTLFTALIVTRALIDFLTGMKMLKRITMFQILPPDTKIKFLQARFAALGISLVLIVGGYAIFGVRGNENFGVDFTTGTNLILNVASDQKVEVGDVRQLLLDAGFDDPAVTDYEQTDTSTQNRYMIHLGEVSGSAVEGGEAVASVAQRVQQTLAPLAGGDAGRIEIEKEDMVGPTVGRQLKWDALEAMIYSIMLIICYLWFRFELKFSVAAIVAIIHDVSITVGLLALTGRQISLGVVAAILTIIGYSLNDTIVVFDRVREDLKLYRGRGMSLMEILNVSVNQTLSRTILTNFLTLTTVIVLLIFGGKVINDFAFALTVGIIAGTYSTIYIASPVVYYWNKWFPKGKGIVPGHAEKDEEPSGRRRRRRRAEPMEKEPVA
ncbi:MAG: hypothetical protein AMXMBFR4_19520 [Candidatus Hydrogenedentota bacterium]